MGEVVYFTNSGGIAAAIERVRENRETIEADKHGIQVTPLPLFSADPVSRGSAVERELTIFNGGSKLCMLVGTRLLLRGMNPFEIIGSPLVDGAHPLASGQSVSMRVRCRPTMLGMSRDVLSLSFVLRTETVTTVREDAFTIGRYLDVRCGDPEALAELAPTSTYQRRKRRAPPPPQEEIEVVPPPKPEDNGTRRREPPKDAVQLKLFPVPHGLRDRMADGSVEDELERSAAAMEMLGGHNAAAALASYKAHMSLLLFAEEEQLKRDLAEFNMVDEYATSLARRGRLWELKVHGLAENRPSVLRGDTVKVNYPGDRRRVFEGRAEAIERESVLLEFNHSRFGYIEGQRIEVCFKFGRTPLRRFHQGIDHLRHLPYPVSLLFPEPRDLENLHPPRRFLASVGGQLHLFNPRVNDEQRAAVLAVVEGVARRVPYCIFGPPGTGKSTSVAELVLQCTKRLEGGPLRILVCTPTNTAADVLCRMLAALDSMQMIRLMAYSRSRRDVDSVVLERSNWSAEEDAFIFPTLEQLCAKTVVVATLATAAQLVNKGVERGHFDLLVVDEAGQVVIARHTFAQPT